MTDVPEKRANLRNISAKRNNMDKSRPISVRDRRAGRLCKRDDRNEYEFLKKWLQVILLLSMSKQYDP